MVKNWLPSYNEFMASKQILKDCGESAVPAFSSCPENADCRPQNRSTLSSRWVSGTLILSFIVAALSYVQHSVYLNGYATKAEVARLVAGLPENCRAIAGHRISAKISEKGAPLTRAEMKAMSQDEADCDAMREQLMGVVEGSTASG